MSGWQGPVGTIPSGYCKNCGKPILVMCFKGEKWCSEDCRVGLTNEEHGPPALTDAGLTVLHLNNVEKT